MKSSEIGDTLEDAFHQHLIDQLNQSQPVFGLYPPGNCKIYKKKKYYCAERKGNVEFDVVIEVFRNCASDPHLYVIFECKNYKAGIPESRVTDFSDKLGRLFLHKAKGILVISSRLQKGAESIARSRGMGIVKFDANGIDVIAERKGHSIFEPNFIEAQIYKSDSPLKSLKFSACYDGRFYDSIHQLIYSFDPKSSEDDNNYQNFAKVPFIPEKTLKKTSAEILEKIRYEFGPVDVERICKILKIKLRYTEKIVLDIDGKSVLGFVDFRKSIIAINRNYDRHQERFTIAHEVGHFCLQHDKYLSSENIIESDILELSGSESNFNYGRLEIQANIFASYLLLPDEKFISKFFEFCSLLGIRDRGFGLIYVDDQAVNLHLYIDVTMRLSEYFDVSQTAVEIKLRNLGLINDQRSKLRKLGTHPIFRTELTSHGGLKFEVQRASA
jgi:Zn-dependent peptidase ImmA (M78 family)